MKLRYATVCSGIDAPAVAWNPLGWEQVFCSEIESFPCAVLKHHHPHVPNYGDMTHYEKWPRLAIDVLIGGTPCQSFSVAGLRKGLADPRGNLALTFLAIVERYAPTWVIWENVPGVFSSWSDVSKDSQTDECREAGRTAVDLARSLGFDAKAAGQFGCLEEVDQSNDLDCFTAGLGELGYGWALASLDAQYFGVAQRRERVFVVGHIGGQWQRAAAVLFDRESLCGNPAPRRETGQGIAGTFGARPTGGGGFGTDFELGGGRTASVVATVDAQNKVDRGDSAHAERLVVQHEPIPINMQCAIKNGVKSPNGTGRGTPLVPVTGPITAGMSKDMRGTEGFDSNWMVPEVLAHGQGNAERVKDGSPSLTCNHEAPILFAGCSEADTLNHADATKANTIQNLCSLREEIGEEVFAQWGLGILVSFWPQEILQSAVHGTSVRCPSIQEFGLVNYAISRTETGAERVVREMREATRPGRSPFGWKPHEQRTIRLAAYLSELSHPGTSPSRILQTLWLASQGTSALQQTLPAVQKMGKSSNGKGQPVCGGKEGLRSEREASPMQSSQVWAAVSQSGILWQTRNANSAGKTHYQVRRLCVTECEFLQGFPRNYTLIPIRGRMAADGTRYKAIGNSMAVPKIRWLGERIELVHTLSPPPEKKS